MKNPNAISPSSIPKGQDTSAAAATKKAPLRQRSPVLAHFSSVLFAGLLTAIPLFITIFILGIFYGFFTQYTKDPADWIVDHFVVTASTSTAPESTLLKALRNITSGTFAIILALLIIYLLGLLGSFFIGRQILAQIEHFIENLPLVKGIYGTTKQVMAVFRQGSGGSGFQRVVLVQFPREGTWTVAFVTNTIHDAAIRPPTFLTPSATPAGEKEIPPLPETGKLVCCFIPMTPNPTSGFFQMFPEDQVRNTDWTVDMGIKIVLSGGLLAPAELSPQAAPPPSAPTSP